MIDNNPNTNKVVHPKITKTVKSFADSLCGMSSQMAAIPAPAPIIAIIVRTIIVFMFHLGSVFYTSLIVN